METRGSAALGKRSAPGKRKPMVKRRRNSGIVSIDAFGALAITGKKRSSSRGVSFSAERFEIYGRGFFQFLALSGLVIVPRFVGNW